LVTILEVGLTQANYNKKLAVMPGLSGWTY